MPFDDEGIVVLSSAPPRPDAPRVPAELGITRADGGYHVGLTREDGRPLFIPGVFDSSTGDLAALIRISFTMTARGMTVAGTGPSGQPLELTFDETTARALAVALLITIGVKLRKAGRKDTAAGPP